MKNFMQNIHRTIMITIIISIAGIAHSQVSKSTYFMGHLPVANSLNPAITPSNNVYINIPIISSLHIAYDGPVNYSSLTRKDVAEDVVYIDKEGILNAMGEVESISFDLFTELGRIGINKGNHSFNFSVAKVLSTNVSLEKNLVKFLLYGNGSDEFIGQEAFFGKTGFKASLYHEFGLGYAYQLNEKVKLGIKLKYLNGAANIWSEKAELKLHTDDQLNYNISASTDILIHSSSSYGYLEDISFDNPMDYLWLDLSKNHGFGGDIGLQFKPLDKMAISASVIDLGMIKWEENVTTYQSKNPGAPYTFGGFDISHIIGGGSISDSITIGDSLTEHFAIETVYDQPYTTFLTPKAYLGVSYNVSKHDQFGLLIKGKFPENDFIASYTLNYRRTFGDILALFVNYTFRERNNSLGLGMSLRGGPVLLYVINDFANAYFEPTKAAAYNVQFGISFVFGKGAGKEKLPEKLKEKSPESIIPEKNPQEEIDQKSDDGNYNDNLSFYNGL
jgi:hypothetical protein